MLTRRQLMSATALTLAAGALPGRLAAQDAFYDSGDAITAISGASPGAGSDVAARYIADYLGKHTPGEPSVVVRNVPGAATILATNQFSQMPADGSSMLIASSSVWIHYLLGNEKASYDLRDMVPIMGVPSNSLLSISPDTGYTEPKDLLRDDMELAMGAGSASGGHIRLILSLEVLGIADKINFVFGYGGGGETRLAFERGEINLVSQTTSGHLSGMVPMEEAGTSIPLFQIGVLDDDGEMVRDEAFPDIQTVRELYVSMYDEEPSGPLYEALKVFGGLVNVMQIALLVHQDTPEDAIAALKEGAQATLDDPEFLAQAEEVLGSDNILVGEALERRFRRVQELDEEVLLTVRRLAVDKYGATGLRL